MRKTKKIVSMLSVISLTGGIVAGCGGAGGDGGAQGTDANKGAEAPQQPLEISFIMPQQAFPIPDENGELLTRIKKYTNTNLKLQWVPGNYAEKLNVTIASGEMPKAVFSKYNPAIASAIRDGVFWEIGPYLKDYPNMSKLDPAFFNNISVEGKLYAVPIYRFMGRFGIVYRKDWMDELGITTLPKTFDEWLTTTRAVAKAKPGTIAFPDTNTLARFQEFLVMQGGFNNWGEQDGKLVPDFMGPVFMDTMKFYKTLYQEKLLNQDFAEIDDLTAKAKFIAGKAAFQTMVAINVLDTEQNLQKTDPKAKLDVAPLIGPNGQRVLAGPGSNGFYVFPKSSVKTEAELKQILGFFDKLLEPEMSNLLLYGIEGRHYEVVDGKAKPISPDDFKKEINGLMNALPVNQAAGNEMPKLMDPLLEKGMQVTKENGNHLVQDPTINLISDTYLSRGKELDDIILTAKIKFIMGVIDENGWNAAVEQWKKAGGDKVMNEFNEEYQKQK